MDKKKIIAWIIICLVLFFIPAIFMKQFFNLDNMVTVPTINYGEITMPGLLAGGIAFWGFVLIICGIINAGHDGYIYLKRFISKKNKTA